MTADHGRNKETPMKRLLLKSAILPILLFAPQFAASALACSCIGRPDVASSLAQADVVFSGIVVSGDTFVARMQVDRIWKGVERSEIVMRTGAQDMGNGMVSMSSCDYNYAVGQRYVVYGRGANDWLIAGGCDRTGPVTDEEVNALDALVPHKRIASEIRRCAGARPNATGEIRLTAATSSEKAAPNARAIADGAGRRYAAVTDETGHAVFAGLQPGVYTITIDLDGHKPRQLAVTLPPESCMQASVFLIPSAL